MQLFNVDCELNKMLRECFDERREANGGKASV